MANRTAQDICLLCQIRLATKRNSHIFPKFWVKNILGPENQKEGYAVSSSSDKLGQKVQDSPKEDFIFCPECEMRFGFLERYIANNFYNLYKSSANASIFPVTKRMGDELDIMTAVNVSPVFFKLFIYSLVWRASISNNVIFSNFKLNSETEEKLRIILDSYLQNSEMDNLSYCNDNIGNFESLPVNIITTLSPADSTSNMIAPFDADDGRILLFANEFMIIIYLDWAAPKTGDISYNFGVQQLGIGLVPLKEWQRLHGIMVTMLVDNRRKNSGLR